MDKGNAENFLETARKQFEYYKKLGEGAMSQISNEEQLFWTPNENCNSVAVIVQHLYGNMLSRWTDFLDSDGEKPWRERDQEFELYFANRDEVLEKWHEGWEVLFSELRSIDPDQTQQLVYIRNNGHTVMEAVSRQLCHYSYHVGQIVYLSKVLSEKWESLSIPKGHSDEYNRTNFNRDRERRHFTDTGN